jgi:putative hemolysin
MNKKISIFIVEAILLVIVLYMYQMSQKKAVTEVKTQESGIISAVTFRCGDSKSIGAIFFEDRVELALSDKRNMLLMHAISASGARYANSDESFIFWNKGNTAFVEEKGVVTFKDCVEGSMQPLTTSTTSSNISSGTAPVTNMANPASSNCLKVGGSVVIDKRGDGGEYGLCYFEDNRACEEWALLRGECPVGGRKTTGFDTIDQKYCAWLGGSTFAVENAICIFKNGRQCSTIELYNGKCSQNK